jgi:Na+-driven multidrug efflux pump
MLNKKDIFGVESLPLLLKKQSIPASIGILVMSLYGIVDTIFVGRWVGAYGIGAITVVMPITFLISSIGMAIGVGGASIISRAFGEKNDQKAFKVFGNQMMLTLIFKCFWWKRQNFTACQRLFWNHFIWSPIFSLGHDE